MKFENRFLVCRRTRLGRPSIMEDASRAITIQETGQGTRPARMVGYLSLESTQTDMDVRRSNRAYNLQLREGA